MTALLKSALLLCTVAVCSCENSSLSYVAPSLGGSAGVVTSVERDLAERFLAYYETEWGHIQKLTDHIGHRIQAVVRKLHFWIPPDLSFRAKDPKSLRDKLMARCEHEENDFKSFPDIASAMYDVIGVRFTTYFPHLEIPSLIAMFRLTEGFHVVNVKEGKGEYLGTNIHLKIDGVDLEVQLRGAFHHSFYQINHKFSYKPKEENPLSPKEQEALIKLREAAFAAEEAVKHLLELRSVQCPKMAAEAATSDDWQSYTARFMELDQKRWEASGAPTPDFRVNAH